MQDVLYINDVDQAAALLKPLRIDLLKRMAEPKSCPDLAGEIGETTQKVYYHVKVLEKAGLVEKVEEQRVGGIMEGQYQATAGSYWLSPDLVGQVGGRRESRDQMSLSYLLGLAEELQSDIGRLGSMIRQDTPSLGLSAHIYLEDGRRRTAFMQDLRTSIQQLAEKYGSTTGLENNPETFRLMIACYPTRNIEPSEHHRTMLKEPGDN